MEGLKDTRCDVDANSKRACSIEEVQFKVVKEWSSSSGPSHRIPQSDRTGQLWKKEQIARNR